MTKPWRAFQNPTGLPTTGCYSLYKIRNLLELYPLSQNIASLGDHVGGQSGTGESTHSLHADLFVVAQSGRIWLSKVPRDLMPAASLLLSKIRKATPIKWSYKTLPTALNPL